MREEGRNSHAAVFNLAWSQIPQTGPETGFPPADSSAKWTALKTKQGIFSLVTWQPGAKLSNLTISAAAERSRLCSLPASSSRRRACSSCFSLNCDSCSNIKSSTLSLLRVDCSTVLLEFVVEAFTRSSASRDIWKYLVMLSKAPRA